MGVRRRILLSWSSGKDSAWLLHCLGQSAEFELAGLLTSYSADSQRVPQHEVRMPIVERQALAAGLPLTALPLPSSCPNSEYEKRMRSTLASARQKGIEALAYGDLHLAEIRRYREALHRSSGVAALFPLWGRETGKLVRDMLDAGLRAIITTVDLSRLPQKLAGKELTHDLLDSLPGGVDPCGENGEFHTCVYAGPMFSQSLSISPGSVTIRQGYACCDIRPLDQNDSHPVRLDMV